MELLSYHFLQGMSSSCGEVKDAPEILPPWNQFANESLLASCTCFSLAIDESLRIPIDGKQMWKVVASDFKVNYVLTLILLPKHFFVALLQDFFFQNV